MNLTDEKDILSNERERQLHHTGVAQSKDEKLNHEHMKNEQNLGKSSNNSEINNEASSTNSLPTGNILGNAKPQPELLAVERYNWLYHIRFVRNEFDQCLQEMDHLSKSNMEGVTTEYSLYLSGLINLRRGNAKSALHQFNLLRSINNPTYIKAIARCLLILGRHQNVCDIVKEVGLQVCQNDPAHLWTLYGHALHFLGSMQLAKEAFQNAIQGTANHVEPFIALAKCHIAEGDYKSAIFVLRRATE